MSVEILNVAVHYKNPSWYNVDISRDGRAAEHAIVFREGSTLKPGPVPEGWTVEDGPRGPVLNPPRTAGSPSQGGGRPAAGFRGTEAGFKYEQTQMNRRTAMMQAVALVKEPGDDVYKEAEKMFTWLQQS